MLINPRLLFAWRFGTHRYALLTFGLYSDLRQCCWCWCDWWYEQESAKHSEALNAITQHLGAGSYLEASARWSTRRSHNSRYCTNTHNQTAHELTNQLFCMPWYMIRHSSDLPWRPFGGFNPICLCIMIFYFFQWSETERRSWLTEQLQSKRPLLPRNVSLQHLQDLNPVFKYVYIWMIQCSWSNT